MNFIVVLGVILFVLLFVIVLVRKIKSLLITLIAVFLLVVGVTAYAIFVPTSNISEWFTQNIASSIAMDENNTYSDGDIIWQTKLSSINSTSGSVTVSFSKDISKTLTSLKEFIVSRAIAGAAQSLSEDNNEEYILQFSDSYLLIKPVNSNISISVVKGSTHDTN